MQAGTHALIIEDDVATANAIGKVVSALGHTVTIANTLKEARSAAEKSLPGLVLVDLGMPDGDGVSIVAELREIGVEDFVVISGETGQHKAVESLRAGVADFLSKPVKLSEIHRVLTRVIQQREDRQVGVAIPTAGPVIEPARLVGSSEAARHLRHSVQRVARMQPVRTVVAGAPGVGKRNIAASLHLESGVTGSMVYVNCAQEIDDAAPSRFFGRRAADGSTRPIDGYVQVADGGNLVLDDLSSLPAALQSKLITFLSTGMVIPVDGQRSVRVECGLIGILREPLAKAFESGRLKEDLYYALAQTVITVPPLSERAEDTLEIAEGAIAELNAQSGSEKALSPELRERLRNYAWPGNVVELKNILRAAHAGTPPDGEILVSHVFAPALSDGGSDPAAHLVGNSFWEVEKKLLLATLDSTDGNKRQAAKLLGISLKTLYNRLHAYS